jgi:site-specific recombinase XerD
MADTLRERFRREMVVRGLSEPTQDAYLRDVELLVRRTGKHPAQLTSKDLRDYFAWLVDERRLAPATVQQHLAAVHRFYDTVLGRKEQFFTYAKPKNRQTLPVVLTVDEVRRLLHAIRVPRLHSAAMVAYSCGLRRSEIIALSVHWIAAEAGLLHIHNASRAARRDGPRAGAAVSVASDNGGVDRVVPLPKRTLAVLRDHWRQERRSGTLLFASPHRGVKALSGDSLGRAIKAAAATVGINRPVSLHTLRHCYASHLLERGGPLPLIQRWLGHKSVSTTMVYAHVTAASWERALGILTELTEAL